jgi:O-antigen ligase
MKASSATRPDMADNITYYHLLLLAASLPFDRFYSHIILVSFILHVIIQFKKNKIQPLPLSYLLVLTSLFFVTAISTIYSINRPAAWTEWGRQITILLFPLSFYYSGFDFKKNMPRLLSGFSVVCTLVVSYLYKDAWRVMQFYKLPVSALFTQAFVNHNFAEPINMHATFLSMQLAVALVFCLMQVIQNTLLKSRLLYGSCALILLCGLMQLCSKSVFVCLLISINIILPLFLLNGRSRRNFIGITVTASIFIIGLFFSSRTLHDRYINDLKADLTEKDIGGTAESRLTRWAVVAEMIGKAPIIGYGAGTEVDLLQQQFFQKKYYNSFLHQLNAHNQYLSFLLKSGVWGLFIYLATLYWGIKQAMLLKDPLFLTFMLLIALVSLSENVLDVDKGVIFFSFFFSLFVFANKASVKLKSHSKSNDYSVVAATKQELVTS